MFSLARDGEGLAVTPLVLRSQADCVYLSRVKLAQSICSLAEAVWISLRIDGYSLSLQSLCLIEESVRADTSSLRLLPLNTDRIRIRGSAIKIRHLRCITIDENLSSAVELRSLACTVSIGGSQIEGDRCTLAQAG